jgi:hypothetical protein
MSLAQEAWDHISSDHVDNMMNSIANIFQTFVTLKSGSVLFKYRQLSK